MTNQTETGTVEVDLQAVVTNLATKLANANLTIAQYEVAIETLQARINQTETTNAPQA